MVDYNFIHLIERYYEIGFEWVVELLGSFSWASKGFSLKWTKFGRKCGNRSRMFYEDPREAVELAAFKFSTKSYRKLTIERGSEWQVTRLSDFFVWAEKRPQAHLIKAEAQKTNHLHAAVVSISKAFHTTKTSRNDTTHQFNQ